MLNVLSILQAACLNNSSYDMLMGGDEKGKILPLIAFDTLVLDSTKIGEERMFRLAEDPTLIIIEQSVRDAIMNNRPEGGWGIMIEKLTVI